MADGYDIIGDVHGCKELLDKLLVSMGYEHRDGAYRHGSRQAVFVGDLIDRGPNQIGTVAIARAMVEAGSALMVAGNHEFNAIAYATADPKHPGRYLRPHTDRKVAAHRSYIDEVGFRSGTHLEMLDWFMTLPLWLDLGDLRIVHASWDEPGMEAIAALTGPGDSLTPELVERASRKGSPEWQAIEHLLKGPEIDIDPAYADKERERRDRARFRWWDPDATTLRAGALIPPDTETHPDDGPVRHYPELPETPIDDLPMPPYADDVPLFYGHYWETGEPTRSGPHTACVDYSACKSGNLVAYQWSGEREIDDGNFVSTGRTEPAVGGSR